MMYAKQLDQKSVHIDELQRCLNTYKNQVNTLNTCFSVLENRSRFRRFLTHTLLQVQELHRDITIRRSSAGANKTAALTRDCELLLQTITTETTELKQLQPLLENSWKETLNSVVKQQVYIIIHYKLNTTLYTVYSSTLPDGKFFR